MPANIYLLYEAKMYVLPVSRSTDVYTSSCLET